MEDVRMTVEDLEVDRHHRQLRWDLEIGLEIDLATDLEIGLEIGLEIDLAIDLEIDQVIGLGTVPATDQVIDLGTVPATDQAIGRGIVLVTDRVTVLGTVQEMDVRPSTAEAVIAIRGMVAETVDGVAEDRQHSLRSTTMMVRGGTALMFLQSMWPRNTSQPQLGKFPIGQ
jgi:hypothetical protein